MKTTLEIPNDLFREVKSTASRNGLSLKQFVAEALREKLVGRAGVGGDKPWMKHFGALSDLPREEHAAINERIEAFCERIDEEKWS